MNQRAVWVVNVSVAYSTGRLIEERISSIPGTPITNVLVGRLVTNFYLLKLLNENYKMFSRGYFRTSIPSQMILLEAIHLTYPSP